MPELRLDRCDVTGIRQLLVIDEDADELERWSDVLGIVSRLIPSDYVGVGVADGTGCIEHSVSCPSYIVEDGDPQVCDGPLVAGIQHLGASRDPEEMDELRGYGLRDVLRIGFPLGRGRVVQMYLDRITSTYAARDVMLLSMLEPVLGRLLQPRVCVDGLDRLSTAERRVLRLVAAGGSNGDVALQLRVSEATVRKHLEHTYRKLDVANRTAAAALMQELAGT
ncbi:hypothetical protein BH10ACT10_BH10ACT10_26400 [soil metagenome]